MDRRDKRAVTRVDDGPAASGAFSGAHSILAGHLIGVELQAPHVRGRMGQGCRHVLEGALAEGQCPGLDAHRLRRAVAEVGLARAPRRATKASATFSHASRSRVGLDQCAATPRAGKGGMAATCPGEPCTRLMRC